MAHTSAAETNSVLRDLETLMQNNVDCDICPTFDSLDGAGENTDQRNPKEQNVSAKEKGSWGFSDPCL